jgi:predicted alpha/beta-hydrolase family hydrolase
MQSLSERPFPITLPDGRTITAIREEPGGDAGWTFIYAPGAGSNVNDPFGVYACGVLTSAGIGCIRLQFPYQEAGKRSPDRPEVLEATWRAAIEALRPQGGRLVVGGRSMGGRIASQAVAAGEDVDALALFAYPLHPPGRPGQARDAHLPAIGVPVLFCSGTNDAFASPEELRAAAARAPHSSVHLLESADHGFNAPRSSGRTRQDVWQEAVKTMKDWLSAICD